MSSAFWFGGISSVRLSIILINACRPLSEGDVSCSCRKSLAAGTSDSNVGKLRSIFKENGRGSTWNDDLKLGNPAAHVSVKGYYGLVLEEQTLAERTTVQAVPMFLVKLRPLCHYLCKLSTASSVKPSTRHYTF